MGLLDKKNKKNDLNEETKPLLSAALASASYSSTASTSGLSSVLYVDSPISETRERIREDQRIYKHFAQNPIKAVRDILIAIYLLPKTPEEYEEFLKDGVKRKAALYSDYRLHTCSMFCGLDESVQLETSKLFELFYRQIEAQLDEYQNLAQDDLFPVPLTLCQIVFEKIIQKEDQSHTIEQLKKFTELFMVLSAAHGGYIQHFTQTKMKKVADLILQEPNISVEEAIRHLSKMKVSTAASSSAYSFYHVDEIAREIAALDQMARL